MKNFLIKSCFYSGLIRLVLRVKPGDVFQILMYHHVTKEPDPFLPHITARNFNCQINYLRKNYRIVDLSKLVTRIKAGERILPRSLALTFDDEYEDIYRNAFPLLKTHGIPATVFIATGFVDSDRVPWTDELGFLLKETDKVGLEVKQKEGTITLHWEDQVARLEALKTLKLLLKRMPETTRAEVYKRIKGQLTVKKNNPVRILNSKQIKEMAFSGINFGAHTVNHPILTSVPRETARREIEQSKQQLEKLTGEKVAGFSYPNGEVADFDETVKNLVRQAGFDYACTTLEGANKPGADLYELRRIWTSEPSLPVFAARLLKPARECDQR